MGRIKKAASPKHEATISPALSDFARKATTLPLSELPSHLASFPARWDFPRGDLYHWIAPLNRFDEILERFNHVYGLEDGPQIKSFGSTLLAEDKSGEDGEQGFQATLDGDADKSVVEAILDFSRILMEKCSNRSLYCSGERLNILLNTTDLSLLHSTLRMVLCLAQRYHRGLKGSHQPHPASLKVLFGIDMNKIQSLASHITAPTPSSKASAPSSPVKSSKGKDKQTTVPQANPNDLVALVGTAGPANRIASAQSSTDTEHTKASWADTAKVRISFKQEHKEEANGTIFPKRVDTNGAGDDAGESFLTVPASNHAINGLSAPSSNASPIGARPSPAASTSSPEEHVFEPSLQTLSSTPIQKVLEQGMSIVPQSCYYELLHKLRVAYALLGTHVCRRQLASIRILAVANLSFVASDSLFQQSFLIKDREGPRRQQFIYQLVDLVHRGSRRDGDVVVGTQALDALRALTKLKSAVTDVLAALNINANHGILVFILQRALEDLGRDDEPVDNVEGEEWRESLFQLLTTLLLANQPTTRSNDGLASPQLITIYISILKLRTKKVQRVQVELIHFFELLLRQTKDGLTVLANSGAFPAVVQLLKAHTQQGLDEIQEGQGYPANYRTPTIDYEVPYSVQQLIRAILPLIRTAITQQGAQADRTLRSLIDSQDLLSTFRLIVDNGKQFGAHVWGEVVRIMTSFLNCEPTSYTIIAEAGLSGSFLQSIVLRPLPSTIGPQSNSGIDESNTDAARDQGRHETEVVDKPEQSTVAPKAADISCLPQNGPQGIMASADAIANVSHAFNAICLTTAGSEFFQASGALETFFEIFESPAHIKVMKDDTFPHMLGSSFDELVRHHPSLKEAVLSAVLTMVSRVRHLCRAKAWEIGAGAKLWLRGPNGDLKVAGGNQSLVQDVLPSSNGFVAPEINDLITLPNGKTLLATAEIHDSPPEKPAAHELDEHALSVTDYLGPVTSFLIGIFENPSLCSAFVEAGGASLTLDLATLQSLPSDFCHFPISGGGLPRLASIVRIMAETKPHLVIPSILDRVLVVSRNLHAFSRFQPGSSICYTDPFVTAPDQTMDPDAESRREIGTMLAKNMTVLQALTKVLSEVYSSVIYPTRSREQPAPFTQVNLTDLYVEACQQLGDIAAACYREAQALELKLPQQLIDATSPTDSLDLMTGSENVLPRHRQASELLNPESDPPTAGNNDIESTSQGPKNDKDPATVANLAILRRLLNQLPQTINTCLHNVGRGLIGRKRLDAYQKQNSFLVGNAIADALIRQLDPAFLKTTDPNSTWLFRPEYRLPYHVEALKSCSQVLFDLAPLPSDQIQCLTVVASPFKNQGGVTLLKNLGELCLKEHKNAKESMAPANIMVAADVGIKNVVSIMEYLTSAKCIVESPHSVSLKTPDRTRASHFNPAQFLLELRLEILPFARMLWDSPYGEQAAVVVLQKLIAVLRSALNGEHEHEALKRSDKVIKPTNTAPRKSPITSEKINTLITAGYDTGLAREALFRCNNQGPAAEEYCKLFARFPSLKRHPLPASEEPTPVPPATPSASTPLGESSTLGDTTVTESGRAQNILDLLSRINDGEEQSSNTSSQMNAPSSAPDGSSHDVGNQMSGIEQAGDETSASVPAEPSTEVRSVGEKGKESGSASPKEEKLLATVQDMNDEREEIRSVLAERCLNVINVQHHVTWELAELMKSATKRLDENEAADFRETAYSILITSLVSLLSDLEVDELAESTCKKIAACAHFVALLIQDNDIYEACLPRLEETFDSLLGFIEIPGQDLDGKNSFPWIGEMLLIIERMLSKDAEPAKVTWHMPNSVNSPPSVPAVRLQNEVIQSKERDSLFSSLLALLPRVGKDKSVALSIARVLVILSRDRTYAKQLGEEDNLLALFRMMRQLGNLADDKIYSSVMLILRHIIEDDDTLRQIMRSEIVASFDTRSSRQIDTTTYVRNLYHLVLRSPSIFVEVTNDKVKLQQFDSSRGPQNLILKPEQKQEDIPAADPAAEGSHPDATSSQVAVGNSMAGTKASVESPMADVASEDPKNKSDTKMPTIEHPDGVVHVILSMLLSKDLEEKDSPAQSVEKPVPSPAVGTPNEIEMQDASRVSTPPPNLLTPHGADKASSAADEQPKHLFRCFLLQCLTELLHTYNRTKIEFINFSRKAEPLTATPTKPRSGFLNYLLNSLVSLDVIETEESASFKKRSVVSEWAMKVIIALCSKTGEKGVVLGRDRYSNHLRVEDDDTEPDLNFVRRFVLEHALRAFKDANCSGDSMQIRYARMLGLSNLFHQMLSKPVAVDGTAGASNNSYKVLAKMMFEKDFISVLTTSLADIDLTFPGAKRVVKYILKPLNSLTETAVYLSLHSSTPISSALGQSEEDVISSASSVSELDEGRDETPDLFRNSALGMLDPNRQPSESSSESAQEDEDDEMYEGDPYADDMEFEEEEELDAANDGEVVSDEDAEDQDGPGHIEGVSGDVPMDLELIMDDQDMELDSDDEDSEDEEEDGDEGEDEEEDGDEDEDLDDEDEDEEEDVLGHRDFLVNIVEDQDDSINEGDEDGSLDDEADEQQVANLPWDTVDNEDEDSQDEIPGHLTQPMTGGPVVNNPGPGQGALDNLLEILDETAIVPRPPTGEMGQLLTGEIEHAMHDLDDEGDMEHDDEDDDDLDEMDENEHELAYQTFNEMLNDSDSPWGWEEGHSPPLHRTPGSHHHHHHFRAPGLTSFMTRHITGHGLPIPGGHRSHRMQPPARPIDDGTNPLLQQPGTALASSSRHVSSQMELIHGLSSGIMGYLPPGPRVASSGMLDAIMEAMTRGDHHVELADPHGRLDLRLDAGPPSRFHDMLVRPTFPPSPPRAGAEFQRGTTLNPLTTISRWQEEARILYGINYSEMAQRVVSELLSVLVPPAIEEEKARLQKLEEDRKREEEERVKRELKERLEREETERKKKQEEEEKEAAAKAQEEAERAAAAQAASESHENATDSAGDAEPMQDVQPTDAQSAAGPSTEGTGESSNAGPSTAPTERVFTTIRGQQVDITSMAIDAEYLEELPEEIREEVIMQQYAEQRNQAAEQGETPADINQDFLEALPEDIREELLQQEATDRRRRERDAARRRATEAGGPARAEEMDADSFMATLDPALRRSILADQTDDVLNSLGPEYAAEARALVSRQLHHFGGRMPLGRESRSERVRREPVPSQREQRKQVVQMVDHAGVATLMRLMFMQQHGSARNNLHFVLQNVCQHRQTRAEVITLLLSILQEGSADVSAVEKSLAHLSLRAKNAPIQKPNFKRSISSITSSASHPSGIEVTPLMVVQQCLSALAALTQSDAHVASVFLREIEPSMTYKSKANRKGKNKESRASKFAINSLISLLDRKLITDNSTSMENLSGLLATISQPLTWLIKKDKDKPEVTEDGKNDQPSAVPSASTGDVQHTTEGQENLQPASDNPIDSSITSSSRDQATDTVDVDMTNGPSTSAPEQASPENVEAGVTGTTATESKSGKPKADESQPKKIFDPPVVPDENLRLVVGVLAARECNGKTFRDTLSTINNLSLIPGAKDVIGRELVALSQTLSQSILPDLNELLGKISEASSGTDIQGIATAKFSPASADQAKLLRVLTALDYLFDPKRPDTTGEDTESDTRNVLKSLYESSTLVPLWTKLSECLTAIHKKEGMLSVATILLPLIESLMVVCKNTASIDSKISRSIREQSVPVVGLDSSMEDLFFKFTTDHRKVLNELVRQNSKLMNGYFSLLAKNPMVLEFDNKRTYFNRQIHSRNREARHPQPPLQLSIRRSEVFLDSYSKLHFKSADEIKYGKLSIRFQGEEGVDAGGVTREWFQVLARGMFNPNYALFKSVASDRTTFHPNRLSGINPEHLMFLKFIGRIIGKALYEGRVLDCHFSRAVYKKILGKTVSLKDMETLDLDYYKSLVWMLENDVTDIITETFSIESDDFGVARIIDLIENGRNIPVTNENKQEYIQLVVEYRLTGSVEDQLKNLLEGFYDIIPAELISIFTEQELELLISGLPDINVDDWKANSEYHSYTTSSPQVQWFWRAVRSFDKEEQAKLLQFVTGTSKVPLNGFKELEGMNGFSRFNIHKDYGNKDRLPSSHTCFNQLDLPEYDTYDTLRQRLLIAMLQGSEYFGFA